MRLLQTMMKRGSMITLAALASILLLTTSCDYDKAVPASELPAAAQTFVKKSYPSCTILAVKKDVEWFTTKYKVSMDNGMEIEFDADGLPLEIDND